MVSNGNAHHTRRELPDELGGGGGGKGTLGNVAGTSRRLESFMTVTEVTTRIAIVGVVALIGLFVVARVGVAGNMARRAERFRISHGDSIGSVDQRSFLGRRVSRAKFAVILASVGVVGGVTLGVLLALGFLTILNVAS